MQNNRNRRPRRDNFSRKNESPENILPSSEILEKFEDAIPGSVAQLIEMAEKEQRQRHNWQSKYLTSHTLTTRIGQACGLIYNIALLGIIYNLIGSGEKELALKLFITNTVLIAFVVIVTTFERRVFSRRPRNGRTREDRRGQNRRGNQERK